MACGLKRELMMMMRELGFAQIRRTGSGHICWRHPSGVRYVTPSSPSDYRGIRNARADIRRALAASTLRQENLDR
jgi:predicted RNA binding protein YcfA (HicA-like mRNA interferase family)